MSFICSYCACDKYTLPQFSRHEGTDPVCDECVAWMLDMTARLTPRQEYKKALGAGWLASLPEDEGIRHPKDFAVQIAELADAMLAEDAEHERAEGPEE